MWLIENVIYIFLYLYLVIVIKNQSHVTYLIVFEVHELFDIVLPIT